MTSKPVLSPLLVIGLAALTCGSAMAASLELGHVRARSRGWENLADRERAADSEAIAESDTEGALAEEESTDASEEVELELGANEIAAYRVNTSESSQPRRSIGRRIRDSVGGLVGLRRKQDEGPSLQKGYLTLAAPPPLRFSDVDPVAARPPSPALPEFNFVSSEYSPYLIENALSEDELADAALLSEIVIELEPHEVVSGMIDTRRNSQEELVEHFDLEEQKSTVLRPEEVLIFFETDSNAGSSGAVVPFAPATPSTDATIKSSATLKKE